MDGLSPDPVDAFISSLELVCSEMLFQRYLHHHPANSRGCTIVVTTMDYLRDIHDEFMQSRNNPAIAYTGSVGRPRLDIPQ